jgi:Short C-terminal domain
VVPRVNIPRAGDHCVVFYDPSDPQNKNVITFDAVPAVAQAGEESDPIEKIEKLDRLRENGIITQAEFEMQKQRLLREV